MSTQLPVLISGAGLCGLLIGRALATHQIPFRIYERDNSFFQRGQGYRLRMSVEGLAAIESILPPDAYKTFREGVATTRGAGVQRIDALTGERDQFSMDKPQGKSNENARSTDDAKSTDDSKQKMSEPLKGLGPSGEVYGVSRGYLREQLKDTISDRIQYGKHITGYKVTDNGVVADFADGTQSEEGCLLIGADGVNSQIAQQLSEGKLKIYDTGVRMIHGQTTTTAFKGLGEGVFVLADDSQEEGIIRIITNVRPGDMDDPDITFGWTMTGSPGMINAPDNKFHVRGKVAADLSKKLTAKWHSSILPIFEQQVVEETGFWKMTTSSPDGVPEWKNEPRVTVCGDAVHSMTPAGGNGANTALITASKLGAILRKSEGWSQEATAEYEKEMRKIGSANVKTSFENASKMNKIVELKENMGLGGSVSYDPTTGHAKLS